MQRVVVTGIGAISPVGLTAEESWQNLLAGKSGVGLIQNFDTTGFETRIAAEVSNFDPLEYLDRKEVRRTDRFIQFAVGAAKQAVADSGLDVRGREDVAVFMGSGIGGLQTMQDQVITLHTKGPRRVGPFSVPMMIVDMASGQVSIQLGCLGPNYDVTSACATGADALGVAYETIKRGDATAAIAGGAEACIVPIGVAAFSSAGTLSRRNDDPTTASRPFDKGRDGFVMGEGGAAMVLESLESALARGATIYAEMVGHAAASDAFHITAPAPGGPGLARAIRQALKKGGLTVDDVDYVNAHGTSTELNDREETATIKAVFGDRASRIAVNSTKSMTGHLIGAAGAFEALVCVKSIVDGKVHPTINQIEADPDCDLDYVPNVARDLDVRVAVSNSLGFGAHNTAVVFKRYED